MHINYLKNDEYITKMNYIALKYICTYMDMFVMPEYTLRVFRCRKSVSTNDKLDKCLYMYKI